MNEEPIHKSINFETEMSDAKRNPIHHPISRSAIFDRSRKSREETEETFFFSFFKSFPVPFHGFRFSGFRIASPTPEENKTDYYEAEKTKLGATRKKHETDRAKSFLCRICTGSQKWTIFGFVGGRKSLHFGSFENHFHFSQPLRSTFPKGCCHSNSTIQSFQISKLSPLR